MEIIADEFTMKFFRPDDGCCWHCGKVLPVPLLRWHLERGVRRFDFCAMICAVKWCKEHPGKSPHLYMGERKR